MQKSVQQGVSITPLRRTQNKRKRSHSVPVEVSPNVVGVATRETTAAVTPLRGQARKDRDEGSEFFSQGAAAAALPPIPLNGSRQKVFFPSESTLIHSSIHWKWQGVNGKPTKLGKALDNALKDAVEEETMKDKTNGMAKNRKINLELDSKLIWNLLAFVHPTRQTKTRAQALVDCVFEVLPLLYPEHFGEALLHGCRKYLRKHVTKAWKFQKTIDTIPTGGLNYGSCNAIRKGVEELPPRSMGVIPSGQTIARAAKELELVASGRFGFDIKKKETEVGPVFSFDLKKVTRAVLRAYGLEELAQTGSTSKPVLFCWSMDGAMLTRELQHLTGGFKLVDPRAINPITGIPLAVSGLFQSRDLCFVLQLAFCKDNKQAYTVAYNDFFTTFCGDQLVIEADEDGPELSNFDTTSCQDQMSFWKCSRLGGGCGTTNLSCPYCMCEKAKIADHKCSSDRCNTCVKVGLPKCYCHVIIDSQTLNNTEKVLENYLEEAFDAGYLKLDAIIKNTKMLFDEGQTHTDQKIHHIDFQPQSKSEVKAFLRQMNHEFIIRFGDNRQALKLHLDMTLDQQRVSLKELQANESIISAARKTVDRHQHIRQMAEAIAVEKVLPCTLHLKMRVVEKLFETLVCSALDRYGGTAKDSKTRKLCAEKIEQCMKRKVMGNEAKGTESQWTFRWKNGSKQMEKMSMGGATADKCMSGLKYIADIVFDATVDEQSGDANKTRVWNETLKSQWYALADNFLPLMKLVEQHHDYSDIQVEELHTRCGTFMDQWVDMFGNTHMTNYIHIIGAGHLTYFARKYRNLYRFSQQGWEAMNQLLKHYYFNNTNHGGSFGNGGKSKDGTISGDHCLPLMKLCQRLLMWRLGHGDAYFNGTDKYCLDNEFDHPHVL